MSRTAAVIGRRRFLVGAGAAVGALAVASCTRTPGGNDAVRFSNWPFYIDDETLEDFHRETAIAVRYTEDINDNDEFFAKVREPLSRGQGIDRDIVVLSDSTAARVVRLGWVQEIDRAAVPNSENLIEELRDVPFDPGRRYTLPWVSGMTGLAYDVERTGRELTSVNDIFDPAFAGHVSMLTEMEDTVGLVMLGLGRQPESATDEDVEAAVERIRQARDDGQIRRFTGDDYGPELARGDVWVAFGWSGDIVQLAEDNPSLRFVIPDEGGLLWSDEMMIPKGAPNRAGAHALMNYYYRPDVAAKLVAEVQFISPVAGVREELAKIDEDLAASSLVFPDDDTRSRLHAFRELTADEERAFRERFNDVVRS